MLSERHHVRLQLHHGRCLATPSVNPPIDWAVSDIQPQSTVVNEDRRVERLTGVRTPTEQRATRIVHVTEEFEGSRGALSHRDAYLRVLHEAVIEVEAAVRPPRDVRRIKAQPAVAIVGILSTPIRLRIEPPVRKVSERRGPDDVVVLAVTPSAEAIV